MSRPFLTRQMLYERVNDVVRPALWAVPPVSYEQLCESLTEIDVIEHRFDSDRVLGMLIRGGPGEQSAILIGTGRTPQSRKFVLCHELIHYFLHDETSARTLCRIDRQDDLAEWQANEGAAELLVPWRRFLPDVKRRRITLKIAREHAIRELAEVYDVSQRTIRYRISGLAGELEQYFRGVELSEIQLRSRRELSLAGYTPPGYLSAEVAGHPADVFRE